MNFRFWMLLVPVVLGVASCSDSNDNLAPVVDDKEFKVKNDGAFTVAENVADLGGFFLAYDSYTKHLKKQGFQREQLSNLWIY